VRLPSSAPENKHVRVISGKAVLPAAPLIKKLLVQTDALSDSMGSNLARKPHCFHGMRRPVMAFELQLFV
jgi:hypothetical protein